MKSNMKIYKSLNFVEELKCFAIVLILPEYVDLTANGCKLLNHLTQTLLFF